MNNTPIFPRPTSEPEFDYSKDVVAREELGRHLRSDRVFDIPAIIGGQEIYSDEIEEVRAPHDRSRVLARIHRPNVEHVRKAIRSSLNAAHDWASLPFSNRAAVFLTAAESVAGKHRHELTAATMLGQSKTLDQAEPDAAGELIDFLRFNTWNAQRLYSDQPPTVPSAINRTDWRPLEGFVYAVSPFNFTAIGANLCCGPALMGNTCLWKPSPKSALSNYLFFKILEKAGLPPGVINFLPADPVMATGAVLESPHFAGLHFTGSSKVFRSLWKTVGQNIDNYRSLPRLVGETGGKDFVFVHPSADTEEVVVALVRGAFEYQGQKCSAASRAYIPRSLWPSIRSRLQERLSVLKVGDVADVRTFMGAVIDAASHERLSSRLEAAKHDATVTTVYGGECWSDPGWFVEPTVLQVEDPSHSLMQDELFGPVLAVFVYEDAGWDEALTLVDTTSPYALTGSIFCTDRLALSRAESVLRHAAGNLYINTKPTGAIVGYQLFGGGRASGTNDKAGSWMNMLRWTSPRVIKESLNSQAGWTFSGND